MQRFWMMVVAVGVLCPARAELPESVVAACLTPEVRESALGICWQVTSQARWEGEPVHISEHIGATQAEQAGLPHPQGLAETRVSLTMPAQTAAEPCPMQTWQVEVTPSMLVPTVTLDFHLLHQASLPPYDVRTWNGLPALVAKTGDWYLIAGEPKAKILQTSEEVPLTTLIVAGVRAQKAKPVRVRLYVGEGALPPEARYPALRSVAAEP